MRPRPKNATVVTTPSPSSCKPLHGDSALRVDRGQPSTAIDCANAPSSNGRAAHADARNRRARLCVTSRPESRQTVSLRDGRAAMAGGQRWRESIPCRTRSAPFTTPPQRLNCRRATRPNCLQSSAGLLLELATSDGMAIYPVFQFTPTAPRDRLGRFRPRDRAGTWLAVPSSSCQPKSARDREEGQARRTLALAVLRGALLDLLATGDADRVTTAVRHHLALLAPVSTSASSGGARNKAGMHSIASCSRRRARDRECASAAR
jgi:hypothetical protein